jgi:hypothetical protein
LSQRGKFEERYFEKKEARVEYFFLSQGWRLRRVWEVSGLWNDMAWRRKPIIIPIGIHLIDGKEEMILYKVEEVIQAIEVIPEELSRSRESSDSNPAIAIVRTT